MRNPGERRIAGNPRPPQLDEPAALAVEILEVRVDKWEGKPARKDRFSRFLKAVFPWREKLPHEIMVIDYEENLTIEHPQQPAYKDFLRDNYFPRLSGLFRRT